MSNLENRVALVTGGTSGIGEATAKAYAEAGAKVAVAGRDEKDGARIVEEIEKAGGKAIFVKLDVTDPDSIKEAVAKTKQELGPIDILFNSAGIHDKYADVLEADGESFSKLMNINVNGVFLVTKEVLPMMLEKGKGAVITVGSQGSMVAGPGGIAYVTSKHALVGFNKQLAYDFGSKGIRANLLAPGFIETPMTEGIDDERLKNIPAQRAGTPEEIAKVAVFLASDDASYLQGSEVTVDGGWNIGR